ncbi:MAG: trypsin-like peptidase domain-containing protein, partial [Rhodobacteraceae bacterium]|nr:trypsin-like peptidase domain-containing protein [Paracoccaceae bacterium]
IRRPERIQSGFFADGGGAVLTAAAGLDECRAITLGDDTPMRRAGAGADGIALLLPEGVLAPQGHAALRLEAPAARVELAVAGFAYGDALSVPVLTYGTMAEPSGAATPHRLTLAPLPADIGGPLLDTSGAVVGMLLPQPAEGGRVLPPEISFAAPAAALAEVLADAGIAATPAAAGAPALAAEDLARRAAEMTVRVACWN